MQSYLFFYDHVAKANYFLENAIDLADEPLDSRTNQYLYASTEAQDGGTPDISDPDPGTEATALGQWDMAVALIMKYGLVPQNGTRSLPNL